MGTFSCRMRLRLYSALQAAQVLINAALRASQQPPRARGGGGGGSGQFLQQVSQEGPGVRVGIDSRIGGGRGSGGGGDSDGGRGRSRGRGGGDVEAHTFSSIEAAAGLGGEQLQQGYTQRLLCILCICACLCLCLCSI
eukprot:CAMPEP_0173348648 /NCGR_PEP_ID=MMETSP1144-20121109/13855_1 /TAXON_ID=483371 /ORGANISM="non described non described, Strain CCMP2298" /LENGTH=137 /DNA_ID=CAMNT_0014296327 /DNA_START=508 /DNA_END=921 /DNA_ORIENTATION=-